jgi:hypothetical protein
MVTEFATGRVDGVQGKWVSWDDREVPFHLLVTVPLHSGAEFVGRSEGHRADPELRPFTYCAQSRFGKQAGSRSAELSDAGRKRGLRARNTESGEVSYRADAGTPPRCMAGDESVL